MHAGIAAGVEVDIRWVHAEDLENRGAEALLAASRVMVVPGGFGERGWEGKIEAARYARENQVPYLGLCFGMQAMVDRVRPQRLRL